MKRVSKYIPHDCVESIFDVDFKSYYLSGKDILFFDLDNTILAYKIKVPDEKIINFFNELKKIGFKIAIISNNFHKRVKLVANSLGIFYTWWALKPFKFAYLRMMKKMLVKDKKRVLFLGDQLVTDICGANRAKIDSILVKSINFDSQKFYTKLNRKRETKIINSIKKVNISIYEKINKVYYG